MNFMQEEPENGQEPAIILIGLEKNSYYLLKGDEYLNQLLLVDGEYPKPVLCVNFETIFDAKRVLGDAFNLSSMWGVHPDIVARLRDSECMIETDA